MGRYVNTRLGILGLAILILISGAVLVACQDKRDAQQAADEAAESEKTTAAVVNVKQPDDYIEEAERNSPTWRTFFRWPSGMTGLALLLTLFIIADQANQTGRAADATLSEAQASGLAAKAALKQVELMQRQMEIGVQRERARIDIGPETFRVRSGGPDMLLLEGSIQIRNIGQSTAYVTGKKGWFIISERGASLPEQGVDMMEMPDIIISSTSDPMRVEFCIESFPASLRELCQGICDTTLFAHLYGYIEYETLGETWHRDFGYVWVLANDAPSRGYDIRRANFSKDDADINRLTNGDWQKDPEKGNGEFKFPYTFPT
jgi:hypothetical protein